MRTRARPQRSVWATFAGRRPSNPHEHNRPTFVKMCNQWLQSNAAALYTYRSNNETGLVSASTLPGPPQRNTGGFVMAAQTIPASALSDYRARLVDRRKIAYVDACVAATH